MSEPRADPPSLSIIIPSFNSATTIARCLDALKEQCTSGVEVLVIDSGKDATAGLVADRYPWAILIKSAARLYPGAARNLGVQRARSSVCAFLDSDCVANQHWVKNVQRVHLEQDYQIVGGPVAADAQLSTVGWAAYFCSFFHWMPGTPAGEVDDIPTCSLSVRRSAIDRVGPFRDDGYSSDTEFNWKLMALGDALLLDPGLQVVHIDEFSLSGFLQRQFVRGGAFAQMRCATQSLSLAQRLLLALFMPALPPLLYVRLLRKALQKAIPSRYKLALWKAGPLVLVGFALWSFGEATGYFKGDGVRAARHPSALSR